MRKSNFELLRIVCMFFIVGIHICSQTQIMTILPNTNGWGYWYATFIGSAGRLVCNTFVIVGAWFLVDKGFKAERAVNLWLEIFMYSVPITIACMLVGVADVSIVRLVQVFLPVFGRPVWFGAEYICLLLLTPWLNMLLEEKNVAMTQKIVKLFAILIIGCATLFPADHTTPAFNELIWFCLLYLMTGLYKHGQLQLGEILEKHCVLIMVLSYLAICSLKVISDCMGISFAGQLYSYYCSHYEALPGFLCSVCLFFTFKRMDINSSRLINLVGHSTFAVYIIHQTPVFYDYMWNGIFHVDEAVADGNVVGYSLAVIAIIFAFCVAIDQVRLLVMERFICKSRIYCAVCGKIEDFYN